MLRSVLFLFALIVAPSEGLRLTRLNKNGPNMKAAITGSTGWLRFPVAAANSLKDEAVALARVTARVARLMQKKQKQNDTPASVAVARLTELTRTDELTYVWEPTPMPFIIDQDLSFKWGEAGEDDEDEVFY